MEQQEERRRPENNTTPRGQTDGIVITYYTDPLCCWSWAMEPQWQQLQRELGDTLAITYKMGGLLPSWKSFNDPVNSIRKPVHMGPEWMHARHVSGADIDNSLWITDPPASSFPACIAVKSAELQSKELGALYLYKAREAVMTRGCNIARTEALTDIAAEISKTRPDFSLDTFKKDLLGKGLDAFKADWQETKYRGINRFPTLIIKTPGRAPIQLTGFQSYDSLKQAAL